jgi:hypothetical protein
VGFNLDDYELLISRDLAGSFEFDEIRVWQKTDGDLLYAIDSGCSCPTPFEWVKSENDLKPLNLRSFAMFCNDVEKEWGRYMDGASIKEAKMEVVRKAWKILEGAI